MKIQTKAGLITFMLLFIGISFFFKDQFISIYNEWNLNTKQKKETTSLPKRPKTSTNTSSGTILDQFEGVPIYSNGQVRDVHGRNVTKDGYNLGLKYQCVEFVKRFYYEKFKHKMPDSYGDAKDYFDYALYDGEFNTKRALKQCENPSGYKPKKYDILVYGPNAYNAFGHVAIVKSVSDQAVTCVAQNLGPGNGTIRTYALQRTSDRKWKIEESDIIGWLTK